MFYRFFMLLSFFSVMLLANPHKSPVVVFASANNKFVFPKIIKSFNASNPNIKILVQYGATGDLTNAILQGVEYDIFLAADMDRPQKVYEAKKSITAPIKYAQGILILFVPADKALDQKKLNILKEKKIKSLTIANARTAPYGKAAIEVLKNSGLYDVLSNKIKYSTDISTAITNVVWYDAAGFLSKSGIYSLPVGYKTQGVNWIEIDPSLYNPIEQGYVISKRAIENRNAIKFLDFILSEKGQDIYKANGYK